MSSATPDRTGRSTPRIVLDCDPGHDDAVAIVAAARFTELLGITTVAGNVPLERTTYNARVLRDLLDLDAEVHSGADRPLVVEAADASYVHGESGLDGADLPVPTRPLDGTDAVGFIIDTCGAHDDVWLVPTGPLTNIALALRAAPDLVDRIAGISLMGGGRFGNRTPVAEFNIWADPDAAAIVFDSGARLVMTGLDVTHRFQATPARIDEVAALDGRLAEVLTGLFHFFADNYVARHDGLDGAPVHDPLAVLVLTHPELFTTVPRHVAVETHGTLTRGMTVIDERRQRDRPAPTCEVVTSVDADAAWALVVDAIAASTR
ncbi:MAG: nucleoside hydrolase [Ilumatobacter sp.]|nr:MAG: nucleoside hydrolase [Ilumatobacter sp.]